MTLSDDALTFETTTDGLLDRRIVLRQPARGYRAGSDAVLLAAAVPARRCETVLDMGAGVGAVSLCLAWRCPEVDVVGLERSADMVTLAVDNARTNDFGDRLSFAQGDVTAPPQVVRERRFDHVMTNPPFYEAGASTLSPERLKAEAHAQDSVPLESWLDCCLKRVKPGGSLSVVHRADRLTQILAALHGRAGDVAILPLWPAPDRPAKRVIVQARAQSRAPSRLLPGLLLHDRGSHTDQANAVLRDGLPLTIDACSGSDA